MTDPTATPVDVTDAPPAQPVSELQAGMVAAGAAPTIPSDLDVAALLAQMKALQDRVDSLSAAAGIPADPIAAAVKNVRDHLDARLAMNPYRKDEFADLAAAVGKLSDTPSKDDASLISLILEDLLPFEGLDYLRQLARDLHKAVLKG